MKFKDVRVHDILSNEKSDFLYFVESISEHEMRGFYIENWREGSIRFERNLMLHDVWHFTNPKTYFGNKDVINQYSRSLFNKFSGLQLIEHLVKSFVIKMLDSDTEIIDQNNK